MAVATRAPPMATRGSGASALGALARFDVQPHEDIAQSPPGAARRYITNTALAERTTVIREENRMLAALPESDYRWLRPHIQYANGRSSSLRSRRDRCTCILPSLKCHFPDDPTGEWRFDRHCPCRQRKSDRSVPGSRRPENQRTTLPSRRTKRRLCMPHSGGSPAAGIPARECVAALAARCCSGTNHADRTVRGVQQVPHAVEATVQLAAAQP